MTTPSPHNIQLRKWILDKLIDSPEFEAALNDKILASLGTILTTRGDLLTRDASSVIRRAKGAQNTLLAMGSNEPDWITPTQLTALLDAFTDSLKGLVPASGGGTANFLRADGAFAPPPLGSPQWTLITSVSAAGGDQVFTGLSGYASIMVVGRGLTTTGSTARLVQVSTNNGSSYMASSGDYILITPSTGAEANGATMPMTGASASALGFWAIFPNFNAAAAGKIVIASTTLFAYRLGTTSALNALKVKGESSILTGGNIDLYGIPA